MYFSFSDIPGHQNLFLDYLYEFDNIKKYFSHDFRDRENYLKVFKSISDSRQDISKQVSSILSDQYASFKISDKTKNNIEQLANKNALAVVTGQQLGVLGGPLYTFHKIITTIKLSRQLSERYDDYNFIPIFWIEGDDHDFNEVRSIKINDEANNLVTIGYGEEIGEEDAKQSVGLLELNESISELFNKLTGSLRDTEFKKPLIDNLKSFYAAGKSFKTSFKELIHSIFDEHGLVILDPQDKRLKELLKPIFKKEIEEFRNYTDKLVHTSAELEEIYHAQVKVKPVNLFLNVDDARYSIEPVENQFRLKRKRKTFEREELLEIAETEPDRFSPNVLLRPICQDYMLPTAFYVAGPSEISYFAQVKPLYSFFNILPPIIYPRSSATYVENSISKILDKYSISIGDLFIDVEDVKRSVIDSISETSLDEVFADVSNEIELAFDRLKEKLFELDKQTADGSKKYRDKINHSLQELRGKAENVQKKKYEVTLRQIDRAAINLYPNSNLQERELNFVNFANKYGMDFINFIFDNLEINKFEHQVIEM
jgi:bacillithiol biosynthesis cysteine-adding enzyme BshC